MQAILIVDDDEAELEAMAAALSNRDYEIVSISSGEEAIKYLKENTVDLILLDMIMDPGINGRETYEKITAIHPNQRAVIISGFAESDDVRKAQKLGAGRYIKKPVTLEKLGLAIKEELDK